MIVNTNYLIALLLIKRVKSYRNSYSLTKVLAWKFDIINFVELIEKLTKQSMIEVKKINGINHYEITEKGETYLNENLEDAKPFILQKYLTEKDFINTLFDKL